MAEGAFGRVFYSEGDYVHDMDLGFYEAYQYSGGITGRALPVIPPCFTRRTPLEACSELCLSTPSALAASASVISEETACSIKT